MTYELETFIFLNISVPLSAPNEIAELMIDDSKQDSQSLHLSTIVWPNRYSHQSHSVDYTLQGIQTTNGLFIVVYILSWHLIFQKPYSPIKML